MSNGVPIQPRSSKGFVMLPQAPEDAGYYVYGNVGGVPGTGPQAQYAHPNLMSMIFYIEPVSYTHLTLPTIYSV